MPHPTQHSLICVLLLWTTILSIFQAVVIILFFTVGHQHHDLHQNSSAVDTERKVESQEHSTPSPFFSEHDLLLGKGQMLTYKAVEVNKGIKWIARNPSNSLVSEEGQKLKIMKEGYYFLSLQVTLRTPERPCNGTVSLLADNKILLHGWINTNTCSTGLLGKAEELSAGFKLVFQLPTTEISDDEHLTHLDIIYMHKP